MDGEQLHWQEGFDFLDDEVDADFVVAAFWDDDIGEALGRLDEFHVHGADGGHPLLDDGFHGAAAFFDIALQAAHEAEVGVGIHEDFDIHQISQGAVFEDEDAFDQDGGMRLDANHIGLAAMRGKIVGGEVDRLAGAQLAEMLDEEGRLDRVGMIEIELVALFEGELGMVFVIRVVADDDGMSGGKRFYDFARDSGFAGAGAAADADD